MHDRRSLGIQSLFVALAICATIPALAAQTDASASTLSADTEATTRGSPVVDAGEVTVTATREAQAQADSAAAISVVTAREIQARGAKTAAEALKTVPGLAVSDYGPSGGAKLVSLRGSTTNEVLILVDGVRVNNAMSGSADLSNISADNIDHIEVLREGGSALYGGDAVGGVVNIITKKKTAPLVLSVEDSGYLPQNSVVGSGYSKSSQAASAGSLVDGQRLGFSWNPAVGDSLLRTSGSFSRASNAYTFIDSNGDTRLMQNAQSLAAQASTGATFPLASGSLAADLSGSLSQAGTPGSSMMSGSFANATETDSSARTTLHYQADRFITEELNLDANLHAEYAGISYIDQDTASNDGNHQVYSGGLDLQQKAFVSDSANLVYGLSFIHTQAFSDTVGDHGRENAGLFFEPQYELGPLSLLAAVRYDYYSDFFASDPLGGLGANLGAIYHLSEADSLKLNITKSYRVPSFEDLYWPASNGVAGNPGLQPEKGYGGDFSYERRGPGYTWKNTLYVRYIQNAIIWQQGSDGVWRPSNYAAALYPGLEEELNAKLNDALTLALSYSYLYSFELSGSQTLWDNHRLPYMPVHRLGTTLSYASGPISASATATYASLRYITVANTSYLPDYFTMDLMLRWNFTTHLAAYFAVDNLFDEQYQIVSSYPMPSTRLRLGAEIRL